VETLPAATILVYLDTHAVVQKGDIAFWLPDETAIFSYRVEGRVRILPEDILQAVDTRDGKIIFQAASPKKPRKSHNKVFPLKEGDVLIHNTYFENLHGIYELGLIPGKHPEGEQDSVAGTGTPLPPSPLAEHSEGPGVVHFCLEKDLAGDTAADGLDRRADVTVRLDAEQLKASGRIAYREDGSRTIDLEGPLPTGLFKAIEANDPVDLPAALKAKIVNPLGTSSAL